MSNETNTTNTEVSQLMSEDGTQTLEVEIMLSVKQQLEIMPVNKQTPDYFSILKGVHKYLHKHCNHAIVSDLIDINPDKSMTISYCTICGNTL
uniref:Uncharacterized protein n=1 Tax=viral metagenome TaxID=1070528 RepID=A0A6C0HIF0_9ZZZZ